MVRAPRSSGWNMVERLSFGVHFAVSLCVSVLALVLFCTPAALAASPAATLAASKATEPAGPPITGAGAVNPYQTNSIRWSLFNATASFLGVPGLVSPVDGLQDEGLGFHADGTTRKVGGADANANFSGQRASAYARSSWALGNNAWLYDDVMGVRRDAEGRALPFGSEHSGRRNSGYGQSPFGDNFTNSILQRGISAGMGLANTRVESVLLGLMGATSGATSGKDSPYGNGKVRLNFTWLLDEKGKSRFGGEGDVLWPLYDSLHTTVYTQVGARSMAGGGDEYGPDRWIGNVGVGQRWFPAARLDDDGKVDSGNWMVGYNAFYDHDLSRGHQRGGVGLEAQYDWLKLATNVYKPLSHWKDSTDFDGKYVRERAAAGWDVRAKGYVPFYRELAVTGSFSRWYGDYVGLFGPSQLEKNPKVWAYGLEYTPVPALTAYVNQRQSEQGRSDTEFGLRFTYHFGMSAEDQFKASRVADLRTVHGSRHDFVDRENKIILEYQTKKKINIEFLGYDNTAFNFRIRDGFGKPLPGQAVQVMVAGATLLAAAPETLGAPDTKKSFFAQLLDTARSFFSLRSAHADSGMTYSTDGSGLLRVRVDNVGKMAFLSVGVGDETVHFDRAALNLGPAMVLALKTDNNTLPDETTATLSLSDGSFDTAVTWQVEGTGGTVSGGEKTDAKGKATAIFTAKGLGTATVTATANGEKASVVLTVVANQYTLTANPASLVMYTPVQATFTVLRDGKPVVQDTAVTIESNANFKNLPSTATADANGQFVVPELMGITAGSQTLNITVGGQKASMSLQVGAAPYSVDISPATLTQYASQNVTFTVKRDGKAVAADVPVTFTADNTNFTNLPSAAQKTNANGQVEVKDFTALTQGAQTIQLSVEGQQTGVSVNVAAAGYTVETSHATLLQHQPENMTFTVKRDGKAVPSGTVVTFTADSTNFNNLPSGDRNTDASGQIVASGLTGIKAGSHTITLTVENQKMLAQVNVVPASYTLEASHATLSQYKPTNVVLTLKSGGRPVEQGTSVTFVPNLSFKNLPPSAVTTDASGQITLNNLMPETSGSQRITIDTVDGQASSVFIDINVTAALLAVEVSHTTLLQHEPANVTFTVKYNGQPVPQKAKLTFARNSAFSGLPTEKTDTSDTGQLEVLLTGLSKGSHSIEMTVEGYTGTISASIHVTPASYTLSASPANLKVNEAKSVTFTLQRNGKAAPKDTPVLFTPNGNVETLPTTEQKTNANGQLPVLSLTAKVAGSQTVEVTVNTADADKPKAQVNMAVESASYTLESTATLTQHTPQNVTFTVKNNGTAVPLNTEVTFTANDSLGLAAATVNTDAGGQVTVPLTATKAGSQTVEITVAGTKTSMAFTVVAASYSLEANPSALIQHQPENVTFTVKQGTEVVPQGVTVTFVANDNFVNLPASATTNEQGQITVNNLATKAANAQTIAATVNGQSVSVSFSVTTATYALTFNPSTLKQFAPTKVIFTVQRNGKTVGEGVPVSFASNLHFQNVPDAAQTTNASGQIIVPNLITSSATGQALAVTVAGQTVNALFTVIPANYSLLARPGTLVQYQAETVVFAVTRDGMPVAAGTTVTFESNTNFRNLPGSATTGANGEFSVPYLTALASNSQTVFATVDGQRISTTFNVGSANYSLTPSISALTPNKPQNVTFTVQRNGVPALAGVPVSFASNSNFKNLPTTPLNTNHNGQVVVQNLTVTTATAQTLIATVGGQAANVPMAVLASGYTLLADPYMLKLWETRDVTFTVQLGGAPVANTPVTFTTNGNFEGLPTSATTTGDNGQFVVKDLKSTAAGVHKVEITVAGQKASLNMTVNDAQYTVQNVTPPAMNLYQSANVTFQVPVLTQGTPCSIIPNGNFKNLPEYVYFSEHGYASLSNIMAATPGAQTLELKNLVNGQHFHVPIMVAAASFTLNADPAVMDVNVANKTLFTVRANSVPVKNAVVTLTPNANFSNWPTTVTTDDNGQFAVSGLTATNAGSQTLLASVAGQNISTTIDVMPPADVLTVSPDKLNLGTQTPVTFRLSPNGEAMQGLSATFTPHGNLTLPTTPQLINASGSFTVPVTAKAIGRQTVELVVDGRTYTAHFTVSSGGYAASTVSSTLVLNQGGGWTFSLTQNGAPVPAKTSVTFTPNPAFQLPTEEQVTDAAGTVYIGMTPLALGRQIVELTVNGQKVSVPFDVISPAYTVTTFNGYDTVTMPLNKPMDVVLLIKQNGSPTSGVPVNFKTNPMFQNMPTTTQTSNASGSVSAPDLVAMGAGTQTLELEVAGQIYRVPVTVTVPAYSFVIDPVPAGGSFPVQQTATITARLMKDGAPYLESRNVTWEVIAAVNNSRAMNRNEHNNWSTKRSGLAWGDNHSGVDAAKELTSKKDTYSSPATGSATVQLTDVLGTRSIMVKAIVTMGGATYTATREIVFGPGPIEVFDGPAEPAPVLEFPAFVRRCGGTYVKENIGYQRSTNLPTVEQLQAVAAPGKGGKKGAAFAAGWDNHYMSAGVYVGSTAAWGDIATLVSIGTGEAWDEPLYSWYTFSTACVRK